MAKKKKFWENFYYYSGAKFIYRKFVPEDKKTFPTGFIWLIGIYIALFGVASNRYENRIDIIENRATSIYTQLPTSVQKNALGRIPTVQNMWCPLKPEILKPWTVFGSLFLDKKYDEMVNQLKETLEDWKDSLESVNLNFVNLQGANLFNANFKSANLLGANFKEANLDGVVFDGAIIWHANFHGAKLGGTNFLSAQVRGANFQDATFFGVNFRNTAFYEVNYKGASIVACNLKESSDIEIDELCKAKTLWRSEFSKEIYDQVKKICPVLLKQPSKPK